MSDGVLEYTEATVSIFLSEARMVPAVKIPPTSTGTEEMPV